MSRAWHSAILRNAALLVPSSARTEWLAEWSAELWYVDHGATAFCLGSYQDALWLRLKSLSARRAFSLDSPLPCVVFMCALAAVTLLLAASSCGVSRASSSAPGSGQIALGLLWIYLESFLVFLTLNPMRFGEYPTNGHAPSVFIRLRRWLFLATKIALVPPIVFFGTFALTSVFPPAMGVVLIGWIFGFRWVLADQRRRCPVCLHYVSNPVEIGSPARLPLRPYGTELSCSRGHGSLYVPRTPTSWCGTQRWKYTCPTASSLPS